MVLPSNMSYGTVIGRFMRAVIDGADAGRDPDGVPMEGLIVHFSPSITRARNVGAAGGPVTIFLDTVTATTDANGQIVGLDGVAGIKLVATNDPDLDPVGWTWNVTVSGADSAGIVANFALPSGGVVDLTLLAEMPPSPGEEILAWQAVVATATNAANNAAAEANAARDAALDAEAVVSDYADVATAVRTGRLTNASLEGKYVQVSNYTPVANAVTTGRLSDTQLEAKYTKNADFNPIAATVTTGRLSEAGLEASLETSFVRTTTTAGGARTARLISPTSPTADTSRVHIRSFQKQESANSWNGGETVWLDVDSRAKSMLTWRLAIDPDNPRKPYPLALQATTPPPDSAFTRIVWAGAHWFAQDKPSADMDESTQIHGHWSVEVPDVDMALRTRFQIFFTDRTDPTMIGTSNALISTSRADFAVEGGQGLDGSTYGRFILRGPSTSEKMVEFERSGTDRTRWKIGSNTDGESGTGGATGSNFEIRRYDDTGTLLGTPFAVNRLNGSVLYGDLNWEPSSDFAQVSVHSTDVNGSGIMVRPTAAMTGTRSAAFKARLTNTEEMLISARIGTNDLHRFGARAGGRLEWSGNGASIDTTLERTAVGRLAVNGEFDIATNLRLGGMTMGSTSKAIGLGNADSVSASNPTGGVWLFAESGVLKYKGTGGYTVQLARQSAIANATDAATTTTQLNAVLAALRTIGLIAP